MRPSFYEFFAGGGMARAGLGDGWSCLFANDFDHKKGGTYNENWGEGVLRVGDVRDIRTYDLPERANLAWGSFPCQDLSLAGGGAGLLGNRSGTFWPFWKLMTKLVQEGRSPELVVLENVCGTLTSHEGKDFKAICAAYQAAGYQVGALVIDAVHFVPQSRPRLFVIGVRSDITVPSGLVSEEPSSLWTTPALLKAHKGLPEETKNIWQWWALPEPKLRRDTLADLIETNPSSVKWHSSDQTNALINMMSDVNLEKVEQAKRQGKCVVGTIYKRTRRDKNGIKVQRAEVRFDNISGCLRTPAGGSSRQTVLLVDGDKIRSRLISTRETARLMGLPDSYRLPNNYNEAYHLTGDGVSPPVVRHLSTHIFEPIIDHLRMSSKKVAA